MPESTSPTADTVEAPPEPALSGALAGLKVADLSDLAAYDEAVAAGRQTGFGYFFPHILGYNRPGQSAALLAEDKGSICVFRWKQSAALPRLDLIVAPTPMNHEVLSRCLERANDFNGDTSARVLKVDEDDVDAVLSTNILRVVKRKAQYIFSPAVYRDLSGGRFRGVRRYVSKFEDLDNLEIEAYSPRLKSACLELLRQWRRIHRSTHGTLGGVGKTKQLLELADRLAAPSLEGEVILLDGNVIAFAMGGQLRPGVGVFAEAKSDHGLSGLSIYQRYHFMSTRPYWELINDGPDVGREGLAQLKNRLRPVRIHQEYSARQL